MNVGGGVALEIGEIGGGLEGREEQHLNWVVDWLPILLGRMDKRLRLGGDVKDRIVVAAAARVERANMILIPAPFFVTARHDET